MDYGFIIEFIIILASFKTYFPRESYEVKVKERFDEGRLLEKMEAAAGIYTKQKKETKERKRNAEEDAKKRGS